MPEMIFLVALAAFVAINIATRRALDTCGFADLPPFPSEG